jgi:DNA replication protein DnaC
MSDDLQARVRALGLHGLLADWDRLQTAPWVAELVAAEEAERKRRSLERRVKGARIGRFKPMADFDWSWPKVIDRQAVEDLFTFGWANPSDPSNVVLVGPNGIGKTMISQNLGHQGILRGYTVKFTTASAMLNDLASQDGAKGLQLAIRRYCRPQILVLDEVGYLSYDNRHADLLFEIVTRRYGQKPIVVTTNKAFGEWNEVFPNAACVVTLVDRLVHASEVVKIDGESYRRKEAKERAEQKARSRRQA